MAKQDFFARDLALATADLDPDAIAAELASFAKRSLADAIAAGDAPPSYRRYVDGAEGVAEERVRADGVILYDFAYWQDILELALDTAVRASPEESGRYRQSWFLLVDGTHWTGEFADIPPGAEVALTNDAAYHRKLEMTVNADHWRGKARGRLPAGIVERVRQVVAARFGNLVKAEVRFITLAGGYVLKGRGRRRRKDTKAGQAMTYPATVFTAL